jgi:hypothetical protein
MGHWSLGIYFDEVVAVKNVWAGVHVLQTKLCS